MSIKLQTLKNCKKNLNVIGNLAVVFYNINTYNLFEVRIKDYSFLLCKFVNVYK